MKKKVLFIDRDGTIIVEPPDKQVDSLEKLEFLPGVFRWLGQIAKELEYELVMITNQDGLGTENFPEDKFYPVHNKMLKFLENEGIKFKEVLIDRSFEHENKPTRKPGVGMLLHYIYGNYDLSNSFVIGDRHTDVLLAKNMGCKSIRITQEKDELADYCVKSWYEIYQILKGFHRKASVYRETKETKVFVEVNLCGQGNSDIRTGIGFFDHMLEQLSKHGGFDLILKAEGDLHVDEHHLIEDVGIALGQAIDQALGERKGISRYGFVLPMDDAQAQVAIDFGGRPYLLWDVSFTTERIGQMPTEMIKHFFKSFTDYAKCNIHIKAFGENNHHKAEAIFKSVARAMKMAFSHDETTIGIPSSKGVL